MIESNSARNSKTILNEVVLIRLLLIILLVGYHAFCPWTGAWKPLEEDPRQEYWWIGKTAYSFMLEAFVFISGYVFAFQVSRKGAQMLSAKNLLLKKAKRLLIPSVIFSIVYLLCFGRHENESLFQAAMSVIEGRAHMWFLPMLFWCFVGIWLLSKIKLSTKLTIIFLSVVSIISFIPIPLRLSSAMYYMLFFYLGYVVQRNSDFVEKLLNPKIALTLVLVFLALFLLARNIELGNIDNYGDKLVDYPIKNILQIGYSLSGVLLCIGVAMAISKHRIKELNPICLKLSTYCFGVYLAQQFILQGLYYQILNRGGGDNAALLPWIGIAVTLIISLVFAHIALKTKIGRFLIG